MGAGRIVVLASVALLLTSAPATARPSRPFDAPAGSPLAQAAFKLAEWRWRSGRIPYYNAARRSGWAVRRAVKAWNTSGARVRFVARRPSRARLLIRYHRSRRCLGFAYAQPYYDTSGRVARAEVVIPRPRSTNAFCSRWGQALVVVHELGHVLGLEHEGRRCATMNPATTGLKPAGCPPQREWQWRCRLLEPDDVRGAVRIYGGRVEPRPKPLCDLTGPPRPVTGLTATLGPDFWIDVAFTRPREPAPPAFLRGLTNESFGAALAPGACPTAPPFAASWTVPVAATQRARLGPEAPGPQCVAVWAHDAFGRRSAPATATVDVPPT